MLRPPRAAWGVVGAHTLDRLKVDLVEGAHFFKHFGLERSIIAVMASASKEMIVQDVSPLLPVEIQCGGDGEVKVAQRHQWGAHTGDRELVIADEDVHVLKRSPIISFAERGAAWHAAGLFNALGDERQEAFRYDLIRDEPDQPSFTLIGRTLLNVLKLWPQVFGSKPLKQARPIPSKAHVDVMF
jgi:hypothetical protein